MIRREFFGSLLAPFFGRLLPQSESQAWVHPQFGEYLRTEVVPYVVSYRFVGTKRYPWFPIENKFVVRFERGRMTFVGLNASHDTERRIEQMSPCELLGDEPSRWDLGHFDPQWQASYRLVIPQRVGITQEVTPGTTSSLGRNPNNAKFFLSEMGYEEYYVRRLLADPLYEVRL